MRKRFGKGVCVVVVSLMVAVSSYAETEHASRPATKKDLVGTWELVSVRPAQNAKDPVFYPYQRFQFNADSSMKYMTSTEPFTKDWLDKFRKEQAAIDFRVDERGVLSLMWQKKRYEESAICAVSQKEIPADVLAKIPKDKRKGLPKKGDMTLSYLNPEGRIAYQKVLTRVA